MPNRYTEWKAKGWNGPLCKTEREPAMKMALRMPIAATLAIVLALCLVGCTSGDAGSASSSVTNTNATSSDSSNASTRKDVTDVEQLQVQVVREDLAEIGEETGNGAYGEYTSISLESSGYDALTTVLETRNKQVATAIKAKVHDHAANPNAQATTDSHAMDVLLGGVDKSVEAVDFINFLSAGTVTRADSVLTCVLESEGSQLDGWGDKVSFSSRVYNSQTGAELQLGDLVTDTSQLPEIIDAAMHRKYCFENSFAEDEDVAQIVRGKLENPAENGELAWTADYLGMKFYFDSNDLSHANAYHGMYVSVPYAEHPGLFADECTAVPGNFIAQLEYGVAYELPGDARGRSVRVTRTHREGATLGLSGTSPVSTSSGAGWTFAVQVGTGAGDAFEVAGEATNSPWFYDMFRQDYMPCLVCVGGAYYLYGFGDRNSDSYETAVYALDDGNGQPKLLGEIAEGFVVQPTYTRWSLPCNPVAVTMADRDCLASYDRVLFERPCAIDAATGMPTPAAESYSAHTANQAYMTRIDVDGVLLDDDGQEGEAVTVAEGTACFLEAGMPDDHYDMRLVDGRLVRLAYDSTTRKIDGHYTNDVFAMVPAASAAETKVETGPRQRRVWHHGQHVQLVPETGNIVGTGAIIDYGDTPWWVAEEFVGTWTMTEDDRQKIAEWYSDGNPPDDGKLEIREDGTFAMTFSGTSYEGELSATRGFGVYAGGSMTPVDGGYTQKVSFDYTPESESDESWAHIHFFVESLPYPMSEEAFAFECYLTRE